jgi:hypothetical protein
MLNLRAHTHRLLNRWLAERKNGHHRANYGRNGQNLFHKASSIYPTDSMGPYYPRPKVKSRTA